MPRFSVVLFGMGPSSLRHPYLAPLQKKSGELPPDSSVACSSDQFCNPGGVVLSGNGHTPLVNFRARKPLSWQVV